jgi:hypothetical protein
LPSLPREGARAELEFDEPEDFADYLADQLIDELIEQIEFDTTSQSPFHLEIWCEKGLPDYIHALARDLGVNVIVEGEGDLSLTIASEFVQRVETVGHGDDVVTRSTGGDLGELATLVLRQREHRQDEGGVTLLGHP